MENLSDIINFGIARAISEKRSIDYITARLIAVAVQEQIGMHSALSAFVYDGVITDALESELLRLDVRPYAEADRLQRWACWLATYAANARRSTADGDALCAFLSLQTGREPDTQPQRRFAGMYIRSFTDVVAVRTIDLESYEVVPLFGRYHVFAR
ncbi:hypothetical protein [Nocardia sp. alder85J]|uniref:hypothetical protein n=1 Tax=Nocardia sp. alder85J TaxID=2862949 RepID=UPI001CD22E75|nr:hypothetical protein [Nocardia sp. alder85J]MCX4098060.1 hypothetical protein [Nocardia sp. alder85J]